MSDKLYMSVSQGRSANSPAESGQKNVTAGKKIHRTRHGKWMNPTGTPGLASIIIPTYNRASLLNEAIASAAAQTYRPLEIIVADDGSTDDTSEVVERWRQQLAGDPHVNVQYHYQPNAGVSTARNLGLIASRGEFIQFLDSDDVLNPEKLILQIACLRQHPECGYVFSDWIRLHELNTWAPASIDETAIRESAQWFCNRKVMWTMVGIYRRETCIEAGPYAEDMNAGEDKEYNFRVLLATPKVAYLPGILCASRVHPGPRLTDTHKIGVNRLILSSRMFRRMIETAAAHGRLGDPRLVLPMVGVMTPMIITALEAGRRDVALEIIEVCRGLPIGVSRRVKLGIYQALSVLPQRWFCGVWDTWLKGRRVIFEIPYRRLFPGAVRLENRF
jgi:glycosyltransferase involved in cell wall biosynthesis